MTTHNINKTRLRIIFFQWIVNFSSPTALVLQCLDINKPWVKYIAYVVICLSLMSIIIAICTKEKTIYKRNKLIELTKKRMINSSGKVVMFGGDLSWANDYIDVIKKLTSNTQVVEIIFPLEKIVNAKSSVIKRFENQVELLQNAGAIIYSTEKDYHLRCTLIDVEPGKENEDLCVISSKRISTHESNPDENKYQTNILCYANDKDRSMCNSFYRNYCLVQQIWKKY